MLVCDALVQREFPLFVFADMLFNGLSFKLTMRVLHAIPSLNICFI